MVCDCCGKKKRLFESFAAVQYKKDILHFCTECNDIAYKVRDDSNENNKEDFGKTLNEWGKRSKKPSKLFMTWKQEFVAPLKNKFDEVKKENH